LFIPNIILGLLGLCVLLPATWASQQSPSPQLTLPVLRLSQDRAIELALKNNHDLLLALETVEQSRGVAQSRLGALLPNLSGSSSGWRQKTFNGSFGGSSQTSTSRNLYDVRASMTQPVFSLNLIQEWRAGRVGVDVADLDAKVAQRDTIATTALFYMEALRAAATVKAREANVKLNQMLLKLTKGRRKAGATTGLDVVRAQGQVESERRLLLAAQNEDQRSKLSLIRAMGIPNGTPLVLTGDLQLGEEEPVTSDQAVLLALQHRTELQAQAQRERFAELTLQAITGERVPAVEVRGDYGLIGENFDERFGTYLFGAFLTMPFYDGQRDGRYSETKSELRRTEIETLNLIQQIGVEARDAQQTLDSTREQVRVAKKALELALEELRLSRKAFVTGTITHFEIIAAQIRLAGTRDTAIEALFNYNAARVNLARAEGRMEKIYRGRVQFLE
jgi:outer membrane protein TolC